jgi:thymidylate synthase
MESRQMNLGFAVGEFLWYWRGAEDLETMLYYNKRMGAFSDDGETLNSAYGKRILGDVEHTGAKGPYTQWQACVETLLSDSDSRRAVMVINQPVDQAWAVGAGSKDVPCTLAFQFFVRNDENCGDQLHMHVTMRSNDAIWGFTNDLFSFTLLHECMLLSLREADPEKFGSLSLGSYYHTAGSMHLYQRHFEQAEKILAEYNHDDFCGYEPPMEKLTSLASLRNLCDDESLLRKAEIDQIDLTKYSGAERWMAERLNEHRRKRDSERDGASNG